MIIPEPFGPVGPYPYTVRTGVIRQLFENNGVPIVFPKVIPANTSLLTDVIDGHGYTGYSYMTKDDGATSRVRIYCRWVSFDQVTDLVDLDAANNSAVNTGEVITMSTIAKDKWLHSTEMSDLNYVNLGVLGLGYFRLRFCPVTNGQPTTIKSIDHFLLHVN